MPFFCDMLGISVLTLAVWWTRKFGTITITGIIATIITLMLNPYATQFFGFAAASVVFDALTRSFGYQSSSKKSVLSVVSLLFASILSTAVAGVIIANLFMDANSLMAMFGGMTFFVVLHAAGGVIGGAIGLALIRALSTRICHPNV